MGTEKTGRTEKLWIKTKRLVPEPITEEEIKASINSLAQEEETNRNWHEPWKKKSHGLF